MRRILGSAILMAAVIPGCALQRDGLRSPAGQRLGPPRRYECPRAAGEVTIDGRLDEAAWKTAPWTAEFVDIQGAGHPKPRFKTRAKLVWDGQYLYIAAQLEEPHVWGTLTERDQIVFHDNDFEIFIDPNGDAREYYEIEVNALNTIFDLFLVRTYLNGGPALHCWDLRGLRSAVHVDGTLNDPSDEDAVWSVEFALPWEWLKEAAGTACPPKPGDEWRVNFSRVEWRHRVANGRYERLPDSEADNWVWSPQGVVNMHLPETWGYVRFR